MTSRRPHGLDRIEFFAWVLGGIGSTALIIEILVWPILGHPTDTTVTGLALACFGVGLGAGADWARRR